MPNTASGLGDLEQAIMNHLWDTPAPQADGFTVRDVHETLGADRDIAYTTVMSTMDNLHRKGWLARKRIGKAYSFWPTMTREERSANLMRDAFHSGGDADQLRGSPGLCIEADGDDDADG